MPVYVHARLLMVEPDKDEGAPAFGLAGDIMDQVQAILTPRLRGLAERVGWVLAVSLCYYVLAYVGTVVRVAPSGFAIFWPATTFLTGVLLLTPVRYWWTYLLGVIPAHFHLAFNFDTRGATIALAATQIAGNLTMAVATAAALLRASGGPPRFDSFRSTLVFILVAAIAVPAVVSVLIIGVHVQTGRAEDFGLAMRQWMLGSMFPTITITPLMLLSASGRTMVNDTPRSRAEVLALSATLFAVTYLAFGGAMSRDYGPALFLAPLPILLWAAARWDVWGVSLSLLIAAAAIIIRALGGTGPFADSASMVSVMSLQVYLSAVAIPLLLLAALMEERRRGEEQLRWTEARMDIAAASTDTGLWQWEVGSERLWMTEHCRKMFGLCPGDAHSPDAFLEAIHPDDRPRVRAALDTTDVQILSEFRVLAPAGEPRWFVMRTGAEVDGEQRPIRVSGVFRDVTQRKLAQLKSEQLSTRLLTLQEDERRNIAEALHDSTTQHLVAVGLITGMIERRVALTEETRGLLEDMRGSLAKAIKELRTFTYLLRPPEIEQQGLRDVMEKYVRGFGLRTGVQVLAKVSPEADALPIERQRALFRIAQESLANIHRHAEATRVAIMLRRHGEKLHLVIKDNGRGMEAATRPGEPVRLGVGIPGMTARIEELGGTFEIRSSSRGAIVHVALPVGGVETRHRRASSLRDWEPGQVALTRDPHAPIHPAFPRPGVLGGAEVYDG